MSLKETLTENNARLSAIKSKIKALPEKKTVTLDLADGNQVVKPTTGKLLDEVAISKPDTLLPENILEGVTIAGVEGTRGTKIATGTFTPTSGSATVTGLGFTPKYVCARPQSKSSSVSSKTCQLMMVEGGAVSEFIVTYSSCAYTSDNKPYTTTGYATCSLTMTDDGFSLTSSNVNSFGTLSYIAIG